jgi:hypothetical protein
MSEPQLPHADEATLPLCALGAILYELLTGRPPFRAATALDTLMQVVESEPVPPRQLQSTVPHDLQTICLKCLHKESARRYASAADLAEELRRFLAGEPIRARPVGPLGRTAAWARRRPALAALLAALAFITALGFTLVTWKWLETAAARQRESEQRREAEAALKRARIALYLNSIDQAEREWRDSNARQAREILESCPADLRRWEWYYCHRLFKGELLSLDGHADEVASVAFSADGKRLASGSQDKTVKVWDARTGREERTLLGHAARVGCVTFSPDGRLLASAGRDQRVVIWETSSGRQVLAWQAHDRSVLSVTFSADGARVATGGEDRTVKVWDAVTGREQLVLRGPSHFVTSVSFAADGRLLAAGSADNTIHVWDLAANRRWRNPLLYGRSSDIRYRCFSWMYASTARGTR